MRTPVLRMFLFLAVPVIPIPLCSQTRPLATTGEWKAPAYTDTLTYTGPADGKILENGRSQFVQLCVPCHGDQGKGDGIAGIELNPKPGNLSSAKVQGQKDGALFWKISKGRGAMAAYEKQLTAGQRWALVHYIRHLAATTRKK